MLNMRFFISFSWFFVPIHVVSYVNVCRLTIQYVVKVWVLHDAILTVEELIVIGIQTIFDRWVGDEGRDGKRMKRKEPEQNLEEHIGE